MFQTSHFGWLPDTAPIEEEQQQVSSALEQTNSTPEVVTLRSRPTPENNPVRAPSQGHVML